MLEELVGNSTAIERAINGEELTFDDGMEILQDDNLHVVGAAADSVGTNLSLMMLKPRNSHPNHPSR